MKGLVLFCNNWSQEYISLAETILKRLYTHKMNVSTGDIVLEGSYGTLSAGLYYDIQEGKVKTVKMSIVSAVFSFNRNTYLIGDFINLYPQAVYPEDYEIARKDIGPRYYPINIMSWDYQIGKPCFGYDGFDTFGISELDFLRFNERQNTPFKQVIGKVSIELPSPDFANIIENSDGSITVTPNKIKYPKTVEDCFAYLSIEGLDSIKLPSPYKKPINNLYKLLVCRRVYWDIYRKKNNISSDTLLGRDNYRCTLELNTSPLYNILIFPEDECMKEFYTNFKSEIDMTRSEFNKLEETL